MKNKLNTIQKINLIKILLSVGVFIFFLKIVESIFTRYYSEISQSYSFILYFLKIDSTTSSLLMSRLPSNIIPTYFFGKDISLPLAKFLGFWKGTITIFTIDFISYTINFYLAKEVGRFFIEKLFDKQSIQQFNRFFQNYLESNIWLMSLVLMFGGGFSAYLLGFASTKWIYFIYSLGISILQSRPILISNQIDRHHGLIPLHLSLDISFTVILCHLGFIFIFCKAIYVLKNSRKSASI